MVRYALYRIKELKLDEKEMGMLCKLLAIDDIRHNLIQTKLNGITLNYTEEPTLWCNFLK